MIAKLEGSDSTLRDEYIVYPAHWDHLGRDSTRQGDQIFNGALDNASGVAQVLEIAEAFTKLTPAPKRSVLFLMVTAEEKNLLGAKYYAENPLYPLASTLANIMSTVSSVGTDIRRHSHRSRHSTSTIFARRCNRRRAHDTHRIRSRRKGTSTVRIISNSLSRVVPALYTDRCGVYRETSRLLAAEAR